MAMPDCPNLPRFSFIHGIILGQTIMVILIILFLVYVVFEDPTLTKKSSLSAIKSKRAKKARPSLSAALDPTPALLASLSYDLPSHPPETLDWFNVLLAQTITSYRTLIVNDVEGARGFMEGILNRKSSNGKEGEDSMIGIDRIKVNEVELGERFPSISHARVRPSGNGEGVRIELDVDYTDLVHLSLSTSLLVNFPRPRFAVLPVSLSLTLEKFSGTLTLFLPFPSTSPETLTSPSHHKPAPTAPIIHLSLQPDFTLQLSTSSLLGSRAKLQDLPKIEQLIGSRIRSWISDRMVGEGRIEIGLPSISRPPVPPLFPPSIAFPDQYDDRTYSTSPDESVSSEEPTVLVQAKIHKRPPPSTSPTLFSLPLPSPLSIPPQSISAKSGRPISPSDLPGGFGGGALPRGGATTGLLGEAGIRFRSSGGM